MKEEDMFCHKGTGAERAVLAFFAGFQWGVWEFGTRSSTKHRCWWEFQSKFQHKLQDTFQRFEVLGCLHFHQVSLSIWVYICSDLSELKTQSYSNQTTLFVWPLCRMWSAMGAELSSAALSTAAGRKSSTLETGNQGLWLTGLFIHTLLLGILS